MMLLEAGYIALATRYPSAPTVWWSNPIDLQSAQRAWDGHEFTPTTYFIVGGVACRVRLLPHGHRQVVELLLPGDNTSEDHIDIGSNMVIAPLGRCEVFKVAGVDLSEAADHSKSLRLQLNKAERRRRAILDERLFGLGTRSARIRMAHFYCELLARCGEHKSLAASCDHPFTYPDLGDMLGLSAVFASRTLSLLRSSGSIDIVNGRLTVHNYEALKQFATFEDAYLR